MDMDRSKTQFRRLQALEEAIRDRRYPNCLRFAMDWEVSQKTIQRDIEFMKYSLGAPIEYDRGKQGYYYTGTNWFLPALNVSEGDLLALALGSQLAAVYEGTPIAKTLGTILEKIADSLPDMISVVPDDIAHDVSFVGYPSRPIDPEMWRTAVKAVGRHLALDVTYRAEAKPKSKSYRIHPFHLANIRGDWYVLASIPPHEDITQFALSRFEWMSLTDVRFHPLSARHIKQRIQESFGQFVRTGSEPLHKISVCFDAEIAHRISARQWHPDQKLKTKRDGSGTLEFPSASLEEAMRWVLGWGRHIRAREPQELVDRLRQEVQKMRQGCPDGCEPGYIE